MKPSEIEFELYCNYVDGDVIESIMRYVHAHGFNAKKVDAILLELGYDEIFSNLDEEDFQESYVQKISHKKHFIED